MNPPFSIMCGRKLIEFEIDVALTVYICLKVFLDSGAVIGLGPASGFWKHRFPTCNSLSKVISCLWQDADFLLAIFFHLLAVMSKLFVHDINHTSIVTGNAPLSSFRAAGSAWPHESLSIDELSCLEGCRTKETRRVPVFQQLVRA